MYGVLNRRGLIFSLCNKKLPQPKQQQIHVCYEFGIDSNYRISTVNEGLSVERSHAENEIITIARFCILSYLEESGVLPHRSNL